MRLSPHFDLSEFLRSNAAVRMHIIMDPPDDVVECLKSLCLNVLEPLRSLVGPIRINSGYRPPVLNSLIGGARNSQHVLGQAADIEVEGMTPAQVCHAIIKAKLPFDQVIDEFDAWCHVSHNPSGSQRGEILTARKQNGGTKYTEGIA